MCVGFCPNEDDQLIVNAVKILNSNRVMVTAVSVNGEGERTNTAVGIVAWTAPSYDVCVYPEEMELFLPPQVQLCIPVTWGLSRDGVLGGEV